MEKMSYTELNDLKLRVEQLENSNDITQYNLGILKEIISIISEFPSGKTLINRATNRYKLKLLKFIILPRRLKALNELKQNKLMPKEIAQTFITKEQILINKSQKAIKRRKSFEQKASIVVNKFLETLFKLVKQKRIKKIKHAY